MTHFVLTIDNIELGNINEDLNSSLSGSAEVSGYVKVRQGTDVWTVWERPHDNPMKVKENETTINEEPRAKVPFDPGAQREFYTEFTTGKETWESDRQWEIDVDLYANRGKTSLVRGKKKVPGDRPGSKEFHVTGGLYAVYDHASTHMKACVEWSWGAALAGSRAEEEKIFEQMHRRMMSGMGGQIIEEDVDEKEPQSLAERGGEVIKEGVDLGADAVDEIAKRFRR